VNKAIGSQQKGMVILDSCFAGLFARDLSENVTSITSADNVQAFEGDVVGGPKPSHTTVVDFPDYRGDFTYFLTSAMRQGSGIGAAAFEAGKQLSEEQSGQDPQVFGKDYKIDVRLKSVKERK